MPDNLSSRTTQNIAKKGKRPVCPRFPHEPTEQEAPESLGRIRGIEDLARPITGVVTWSVGVRLPRQRAQANKPLRYSRPGCTHRVRAHPPCDGKARERRDIH